MLTAAGSSLVAGATVASKTIKVRALRAFLVKAQRVEVGAVIEILRATGMELVSANKAEVVKDEPAAPPVQVETKAAEAPKPLKRAKE